MHTISEDIRLSIEKNLPAVVGDQLKQVLLDYEKVRADNAKLQAKVEELSATLAAARQNLAEIMSAEDKLLAAQKTLESAKQAQDNANALHNRMDATVARACYDTLLGAFNTVMRNTEIRTNIQKMVGVPVSGMPGFSNNGYNQPPTPGTVMSHPESESITNHDETPLMNNTLPAASGTV
jgi:hypothetical protein